MLVLASGSESQRREITVVLRRVSDLSLDGFFLGSSSSSSSSSRIAREERETGRERLDLEEGQREPPV